MFTESVQKSLEKMFGKGGSIPIRASDEFAKRMGVSDVVSALFYLMFAYCMYGVHMLCALRYMCAVIVFTGSFGTGYCRIRTGSDHGHRFEGWLFNMRWLYVRVEV